MTSLDHLDELLTAGGKSFKFETPGDSVTGTVQNVDVRQVRDFDTGKPTTWDDGRPQEQIVITLSTSLRDPEITDDDGTRSVYVKGWGDQLRAFRAAVKAAGGKPEPGDTFTATFTGFGEKGPRGGFPPKKYVYELRKASPLDGVLAGQQPAAQQAYAPQAYQPQAPQAYQQPAPQAYQPQAQSAAVTDTTEKARQLIALGLDDNTIANATGLDVTVIATIRANVA